jgi:hypothetical protein
VEPAQDYHDAVLRCADDFLNDACRWEAVSSVRPLNVEPELEVAEVGRFR